MRGSGAFISPYRTMGLRLQAMRITFRAGLWVAMTAALTTALHVQEAVVYTARDTLSIGMEPDPRAAAILANIAWPAREFSVTVTGHPHEWTDADRLVEFDSPRPDKTAHVRVNRVVLEWYLARDESDAIRDHEAPSVILLHSLDTRLAISRSIAKILARHGIHAFLMHSPGYGRREYEPFRGYGDRFFERAMQAIADARRARDAVARLPGVLPHRVSIEGLSLGGFFATGAASLDGAFDYVFLHLSGADLYTLFTQGLREAQWVRQSMARYGVDDEKLKSLCETMELSAMAHRLNPRRTYLYSAAADQVVPKACTQALLQAAGLDASHHIQLSGDHYLALLHLPRCSEQMAAKINADR